MTGREKEKLPPPTPKLPPAAPPTGVTSNPTTMPAPASKPVWQQAHGPALIAADLAATANNAYIQGNIPYFHNPLYDAATSLPELIRLIHNDSVCYHEKYMLIFGPLFPVIFNNPSMVLGQAAENDCSAAIPLIKKIKEIVTNLKNALPYFWATVQASNGFIETSSDPMIAQFQKYAVQDMCRRVLRLIMVERSMKWLQAPTNRGSANNGLIAQHVEFHKADWVEMNYWTPDHALVYTATKIYEGEPHHRSQ